jgi:asparagine synthase (glutamine-hydrolysing)
MCGIFTLVRFGSAEPTSTAAVITGTHAVRHRGPDDEGYLLWEPGAAPALYAGPDTVRASREEHRLQPLPASSAWRVAFGHRRLSIVDLTPAGHQPMVHAPTGLSVCFNGEIYNWMELRAELEGKGHRFVSHCDTEVILAAWAEWGPACLQRFNGMFSFALLDPRDGTLHVVRDRFGIKPLYSARVGDAIAFASEIKQIRLLPGYRQRVDMSSVRDYLAAGQLDFDRHTFDQDIQQLLGGERAVVRVASPDGRVEIHRWYELRPERFDGSLDEAAERFRALLTDSVALRLRADVPVGSCLSGGLDSSAIVCLAHGVLEGQGEHQGQATVTARFEEGAYDEWGFAEQVIAATGARAHQVWPSVERLKAELDQQIWYMDDPFGSTSQFSQWCVFAGAADAGLTVMLDGQGSDEQLAGYSGNNALLYAGLMRRARLLELGREIGDYRARYQRMPIGEMVFALRSVLPIVDRVLPAHVRVVQGNPEWLRLDAPSRLEPAPPRDLSASLMRQTLSTSLPVLLRYEDRNSMARSIESRVPFLDYRLVEFAAGLPDAFKLRKGLTKIVLREAMRGVLPERVRDRRDKMGFVTPEQIWLRRTATAWWRERIAATLEAAPDLFDADAALRMVDDMADGRRPFDFEPWRLVCFGRWLEVSQGTREPEVANPQPPVAAGA